MHYISSSSSLLTNLIRSFWNVSSFLQNCALHISLYYTHADSNTRKEPVGIANVPHLPKQAVMYSDYALKLVTSDKRMKGPKSPLDCEFLVMRYLLLNIRCFKCAASQYLMPSSIKLLRFSSSLKLAHTMQRDSCLKLTFQIIHILVHGSIDF